MCKESSAFSVDGGGAVTSRIPRDGKCVTTPSPPRSLQRGSLYSGQYDECVTPTLPTHSFFSPDVTAAAWSDDVSVDGSCYAEMLGEGGTRASTAV